MFPHLSEIQFIGGQRVDREMGKKPSVYKCKLPKEKSTLMNEKVLAIIYQIIYQRFINTIEEKDFI